MRSRNIKYMSRIRITKTKAVDDDFVFIAHSKVVKKIIFKGCYSNDWSKQSKLCIYRLQDIK